MACPAVPYFSTLSHKLHDFRKKKKDFRKLNVCFDFMYKFVNIPHSKKKCATYDRKCILIFMSSARYSCQTLMNLEFSQQIFEKYSNIKFNDNLSSGSGIVPCRWTDGRTDTHDEANSRSSQFCERA